MFAPTIAYQTLQATLPAGVPDEELLPLWKDQIGGAWSGAFPPTRGRSDSGSAAAAATRSRWWSTTSTPVTLKPFSPVPDVNGDVAIEGRLEEGDADYFDGYVNQGRFGVKECLVDPSVERPNFRVTCRMAPDDQTAWIQIVYAAPRSVLAHPIVQVLARRDAQKSLVYTGGRPTRRRGRSPTPPRSRRRCWRG